MSRRVIVAGAGLVAISLAWAGGLAWRPQDGETARVVVGFGWVHLSGALGLVAALMGVLARMRRRRRPLL
ncbi:hypothetical protein [Jannaschia seohaensis]|uniref:Uncharacterized protein n=1 Tax=Jannaschia seohaensis TaxID=475081 RepID=A0A2Y9C2K8_9RHOB|nr:hypothetical protein [Jannaschia seohaensis]PWJ15043.1 hypothetical protein BCF38_11160 [Jannaschia seohaensis]SSA49892.1 hypothetical protein SAMN05421539_11160 [Jannaschia seohaensis]